VGRLLAADGCLVEVDALFSMLLPDSDRNRDDRMLAYEAAHLLARMLLKQGRSVVLECTYARLEQRLSLVVALAELPEAPLWVVELFVSPDDAVTRFRERDQATDLDEASLRERAAEFPYSELPLRLTSSAAPPDQLARRISEWLRQRPPAVDRDEWAAAGRGWR
jgi:predicted kinase